MEGLLRNLVPTIDTIKMFSSNLNDTTKQVVVVINGERYTMSPKLTEEFRNKRVTLDELGDYTVRTVEGADGTTFNSLGYAGEDVLVKVAGWAKAKSSGVKEFTLAEFSKTDVTFAELIA